MLAATWYIFFFACLIIENPTDMKSLNSTQDDLIPAEVGDWQISESNTYTQDNLFEYINGGAELFISFGFSNVYSKIYTAPDQPGIILDVFSMNSSADAFGVFSFSTETVNSEIGQGAYQDKGVILFWKDHYYVSIMAYPETNKSRKAITDLAHTIESNIGTAGNVPEVLAYLPEEQLVKESIRYFHHPAWINTHYYISDENIFLIDSRSHCLLARYDQHGKQVILLLIAYHDPKVARAGFQSFVQDFIPELDRSGAVQLEDGTYVGCKRMNSFLAVAFNGSKKEAVINLIDSAIELYNSKIQLP